MPPYILYDEDDANRMLEMLPGAAREQFAMYVEDLHEMVMGLFGKPANPVLVKQAKCIYLQDWCTFVSDRIEEESPDYQHLMESGEHLLSRPLDMNAYFVFHYIQHMAPLVERYVLWPYQTWAVWNPPSQGKRLVRAV
jgi:hypothetical protein